MEIKDSGARREFETGAVRDIQDGKGRCDLLPLEQVAILIDSDGGDDVLNDIYQYQQTGDVDCIIQAIYDFCYVRGWTMPQELGKGASCKLLFGFGNPALPKMGGRSER